ncbi:major facilitator superfamily domain-containing protein [Usnea florida]
MGTVPQDLQYGLAEAIKNKEIREAQEDRILLREGHKEKWFRLHVLFRQNWHVIALVGCCSLGAMIQGWDETAINGGWFDIVMGPGNSPGSIDPGIIGLINAAPYLMCIFSCCLTGLLNRYLGRKGTIMFCCLFSFASCLGQAFAQSWHQLFVCRLLLGFGIGPKSATIPIYAAESVPSEEIRGAIVMTWQLCTAFGIMLGYIFTYAFQNLHGHLNWRFMVGSPMIAPAILFFLMLALPESPRWHLLQAKRLENCKNPNRLHIIEHYEKAFDALRRLRYTKLQAARDLYTIDIWLRMDEAQSSPGMQEDQQSLGLRSRLETRFPDTFILFKDPRCLRAMMSGLIVLSLQQICGINVFAYYSSSVYKDSLPYSLGVGGINFGLAVVALFLIDSVGRRLLLVLTLPLMSACQFATAFTFGTTHPVVNHWRHKPVLICSYLFCVFYSIGEGPVPLVYASEILPLEVRDTGVGLLTGVYWGLNSLMALTWPPMYSKLNPEGSFSFFGGLNLIGWALVILFVPDTSRYKLEEVDKVFRFSIGQIMNNGWAQMKWLAGKKGPGTSRWAIRNFPELVPRSNDMSNPEFELVERGASTGSSETVDEESEATNGHIGSPANR